MGQYYKAMCIDTRESLEPQDYKCGAKLIEFACFNRKTRITNEFMSELVRKMTGDWKGMQVLIVGDYANEQDYDGDSKVWGETLLRLKEQIDWKRSLYSAEAFASVIEPAKRGKVPRYIVNAAKSEYIDLESDAIKPAWEDDDELSVFPLPLLLAIGNGRGSGDYDDDENLPGSEYVGSWVSTAESVRLTDDEKETEGLKEIMPGFRLC